MLIFFSFLLLQEVVRSRHRFTNGSETLSHPLYHRWLYSMISVPANFFFFFSPRPSKARNEQSEVCVCNLEFIVFTLVYTVRLCLQQREKVRVLKEYEVWSVGDVKEIRVHRERCFRGKPFRRLRSQIKCTVDTERIVDFIEIIPPSRLFHVCFLQFFCIFRISCVKWQKGGWCRIERLWKEESVTRYARENPKRDTTAYIHYWFFLSR